MKTWLCFLCVLYYGRISHGIEVQIKKPVSEENDQIAESIKVNVQTIKNPFSTLSSSNNGFIPSVFYADLQNYKDHDIFKPTTSNLHFNSGLLSKSINTNETHNTDHFKSSIQISNDENVFQPIIVDPQLRFHENTEKTNTYNGFKLIDFTNTKTIHQNKSVDEKEKNQNSAKDIIFDYSKPIIEIHSPPLQVPQIDQQKLISNNQFNGEIKHTNFFAPILGKYSAYTKPETNLKPEIKNNLNSTINQDNNTIKDYMRQPNFELLKSATNYYPLQFAVPEKYHQINFLPPDNNFNNYRSLINYDLKLANLGFMKPINSQEVSQKAPENIENYRQLTNDYLKFTNLNLTKPSVAMYPQEIKQKTPKNIDNYRQLTNEDLDFKKPSVSLSYRKLPNQEKLISNNGYNKFSKPIVIEPQHIHMLQQEKHFVTMHPTNIRQQKLTPIGQTKLTSFPSLRSVPSFYKMLPQQVKLPSNQQFKLSKYPIVTLPYVVKKMKYSNVGPEINKQDPFVYSKLMKGIVRDHQMQDMYDPVDFVYMPSKRVLSYSNSPQSETLFKRFCI